MFDFSTITQWVDELLRSFLPHAAATLVEFCLLYTSHIFFPNFMYYPRDILLSRRDYKSKKKNMFYKPYEPEC